ncbi:MAG: T9SS type A sorting domain-containing protein [Saprospiraceae bacterium]|nr:T9SS type A sorting domain-containing protein [Saprospiraceae bacterium]
MKKLTQIFILLFIVGVIGQLNAVPTPPAGYKIRKAASGGPLAGQTLFGIVVDPNTADVYVAGVSAFIGGNFNLYKITPSGTVSFIANYPFGYFQAVKMAWGPDNKIYTHNSNTNSVHSIDPVTGTSTVYSTGVVLGSPRHSLNFDGSGKLIVGYESMFDFIWAKNPTAVYWGSVTASVPNGNHGDGFGILPNGDYVVYSDCGSQNNYAISTAGHTQGANFPSLAWTGTTNIFTIMTGCQYSLGTVDPTNGNVFTTINNGGSGNSTIILTGGSGGASTVYISGASAITDIYSGKASSGPGNHLYFVDRIDNAVYEVVECACDNNGSFNGSFEISCVPPNTIGFLSAVTGWTTNDSNFEIWGTGNEGVAAYHGSNYCEVNSNFPSTIHQDVTTCDGVLYYWQCAHRGRLGTQTAVLEVGPVGGPFTTLATMTDGTTWNLYSGSYLIPAGQTVSRLRVRGINGGSVGNFVDAIGLVPMSSCLSLDNDGDGLSANYGDCNDSNPNVKPCAQEICNSIDDDCDGLVDGDDPGFVSTDPNAPEYIDNTLPIIICPANVSHTTSSGNCGPVPSGSVALGLATATDNCIVITSIVNNAPGSYPLGVTNVKWTATDKKGNKSNCIQKVTILPYACGVPIQIYHTDTTSTTAKIKWKAGTCNTDYQLRIRKEITPGVWGSWGGWVYYSEDPALQHNFLGLMPSSFYQYQIRSKCGAPTNSISVNGWFHTLAPPPLKKLLNVIAEKLNFSTYNEDNQKTIGIESDLAIIAIPNPARDFVTIQIEGFKTNDKELSMFDLMGKLIFRVQLDAVENNPEIDLKQLGVKPGVHMIRVSDGVNQKTIQLIIGS